MRAAASERERVSFMIMYLGSDTLGKMLVIRDGGVFWVICLEDAGSFDQELLGRGGIKPFYLFAVACLGCTRMYPARKLILQLHTLQGTYSNSTESFQLSRVRNAALAETSCKSLPPSFGSPAGSKAKTIRGADSRIVA